MFKIKNKNILIKYMYYHLWLNELNSNICSYNNFETTNINLTFKLITKRTHKIKIKAFLLKALHNDFNVYVSKLDLKIINLFN